MVIIRNLDNGENWVVGHTGYTTFGQYIQHLNTTAAEIDANNAFNDTAPTADVFTVGGSSYSESNRWTQWNGDNYIAYCFHSVSGYSKFGSYSGNGGSNAITTGFEPAFLVIKRADGGTGGWMMYDNVRGVSQQLQANSSAAEDTVAGKISFQSTGFTCLINHTETNSSGDNYIYMAFADTREYAYWLDQSGNNNDWTSNNLTESDISVDSPTNNFATWNPLNPVSSQPMQESAVVTYSEGNLKTDAGNGSTIGTMGANSGKWYYELLVIASGTHTDGIGWFRDGTSEESIYRDGATFQFNGSGSSYGATWQTAGDIIGVALDLDNTTISFYKNGVSQGNAKTNLPVGTYIPVVYNRESGGLIANFGQDSSFAGNKTAQGNQDGNDIGDFYYTPPTGFLALCTSNLPDVAVIPSEHFNTVLYTGNGGTGNHTGVGFQPDLCGLKVGILQKITHFTMLFVELLLVIFGQVLQTQKVQMNIN